MARDGADHVTGSELVPAGTDDALLLAVLERGKDIDVEVIERIVALKERTDDRAATRSMYDAIASFQSKCPPIPKTRRVEYASRKGGTVSYSYAPLEEIAAVIREPLFENRLGYTWDSKTDASGGIKCRAPHRPPAARAAPHHHAPPPQRKTVHRHQGAEPAHEPGNAPPRQQPQSCHHPAAARQHGARCRRHGRSPCNGRELC